MSYIKSEAITALYSLCFYFMSVDDIIGNLKSSVLQIFTGKQKIKTHSPRDRQ